MKHIINLFLLLAILLLGYLLYNSIKEPIAFKAEKDKRETAVISKLMTIRQAQDMYRNITGKFAPNFDTLQDVLTNGRFRLIKASGDADDPTNTQAVVFDTTYFSAIDSVRALKIDLSNLASVPYSDGEKFSINADTLTYQSTLVNVVEVGVLRKAFMGRFGDPKYGKYDNRYDPMSILKFGDMYSPNTSGNWE